jgi:hypothetical protein
LLADIAFTDTPPLFDIQIAGMFDTMEPEHIVVVAGLQRTP